MCLRTIDLNQDSQLACSQVGFTALCERLLGSGDPALCALPNAWLDTLIKLVAQPNLDLAPHMILP